MERDREILLLNSLYRWHHRPVSFSVRCDISRNSCFVTPSHSDSIVPQWSICDDSILSHYAMYLDNLLYNVNIPYDALFDTSRDDSYLSVIDKFYEDIFTCIDKAVAVVIPIVVNVLLIVSMYLDGTRLCRKSMKQLGMLA